MIKGAETFEEVVRRESAEYSERQHQAADALNKARERIGREKIPLLEKLRAAEDRIIQLESETRRVETGEDRSAEVRRNLLKDIDSVGKTRSYITTLAHDSLKAVGDGFAPGEMQSLSDRVQALQQHLENGSAVATTQAGIDVAEFIFERTQRELGGYMAKGDSIYADDNRVYKGTYAFVGPETYFRADDGLHFGLVRLRQGSDVPITHPVASWKPQDASAFFSPAGGMILADASGGKALKLAETKGSLWAHIQKGGAVAFAILAVGLVALLMIFQKITDVARIGVASPETVQAFLGKLLQFGYSDAERNVSTLRDRTAELFSVGLAHREETKALLEEHLQAVLLEQRLHLERRLPLLAVIATAAPLMGLLGTVVGMVRTFALITVFGTGNAGKLSSGISEVLVATELGLVVAIPTLVAHGFLAHRIQKKLSLQERYALQLVMAIETMKAHGSVALAANPAVR